MWTKNCKKMYHNIKHVFNISWSIVFPALATHNIIVEVSLTSLIAACLEMKLITPKAPLAALLFSMRIKNKDFTSRKGIKF